MTVLLYKIGHLLLMYIHILYKMLILCYHILELISFAQQLFIFLFAKVLYFYALSW